jgi:hypothetical protein
MNTTAEETAWPNQRKMLAGLIDDHAPPPLVAFDMMALIF